MNENKMEKFLQILVEQYESEPLYNVTSSSLRSRLGLPVEDIRPYAEALEEEGLAHKVEGFAPTFTIGLNERGHRTFIKYGR